MRIPIYQQKVRCPNCGSEAQRSYFPNEQKFYNFCSLNRIIETECHHCDYLMVMSSLSGHVLESYYAPATYTQLRSKSSRQKI